MRPGPIPLVLRPVHRASRPPKVVGFVRNPFAPASWARSKAKLSSTAGRVRAEAFPVILFSSSSRGSRAKRRVAVRSAEAQPGPGFPRVRTRRTVHRFPLWTTSSAKVTAQSGQGSSRGPPEIVKKTIVPQRGQETRPRLPGVTSPNNSPPSLAVRRHSTGVRDRFKKFEPTPGHSEYSKVRSSGGPGSWGRASIPGGGRLLALRFGAPRRDSRR